MEDLNSYNFSTKYGFNSILLKLRYDELSKYFRGKTCLEFGCADGEGTKKLSKYFEKVVAVDGSSMLINKAKKEITYKNVVFINSKFEKLNFNEKFDTVILAHILEHVDNPRNIINVAKKFISKNGVLIIDVPNALSIHRQVGKLMGMIDSEYQLNEADYSIGHKRVYDMKTLKDDIKSCNLRILKTGGLFIKPFSNSQMEKLISERGIDAFNEVGKKYPEISAEIFVICKL